MVSQPVSGILWSLRDRWPSIFAVYPRAAGLRRRAGSSCPLLDLAPDGVYRAVWVAPHAGALLPHRFTLTCDRRDRSRRSIGGLSLLHVRQVAPTWLSPASCPVESRLSSTRSDSRPSCRGHPADSPSRTSV